MTALALVGALALFLAAPASLLWPRLWWPARVLAALGAVALLLAAESPGAWPILLLAVAAAGLGTPTALALAAGGATVLALGLTLTASAAVALCGLATAFAADSLDAARRARRAEGGDAATSALVAGSALVILLALVDRGSVLSWSLGVGMGPARAILPGVGVLLGLGLLAALAGSLLLAARRLASIEPVRPIGLGLLGVAAGLTAAGSAVALTRAAGLAGEAARAAALPLGGLVAGTGLLAASVLEARGVADADAGLARAREALSGRATAVLAFLAAGAAGVEGWLRDGSYGTGLMAGTAAAALLTLAALEPTRFPRVRRVATLAALVSILV